MNLPSASSEAVDQEMVIVDQVGAKAISVTPVPARTEGGNIQIQYEAEDYAEAEGDTSLCS